MIYVYFCQFTPSTLNITSAKRVLFIKSSFIFCPTWSLKYVPMLGFKKSSSFLMFTQIVSNCDSLNIRLRFMRLSKSSSEVLAVSLGTPETPMSWFNLNSWKTFIFHYDRFFFEILHFTLWSFLIFIVMMYSTSFSRFTRKVYFTLWVHVLC